MDASAIKLIQDTALAASDAQNIMVVGKTDFPVAVLADGFHISDLEGYQQDRNRFRGTFETRMLDDFVRYVKNRDDGRFGTVCFIDSKSLKAKGVFNLGNVTMPGHGDDAAILGIEHSVAYAEVLSIDGVKKCQRDLAEWLEDWRYYLTALAEDGDEIDFRKAIAAVRKITLDTTRAVEQSEQSHRASRSALESIEARGADNALPAGFTFSCEPAVGFARRDLYLRLGVLLDGKVEFKLRLAERKATEDAILQEFRQLLIDQLGTREDGTGIACYIGTFQLGK
jgi:uncharacterized protein YfdQ (DUF2303 family)